VHYGRAGSGHYVTYALNSFSHQWYEYDDDAVRTVDATSVQNAEAYVLFYRSVTRLSTDGERQTTNELRRVFSERKNRI
jgi:hypothetical protein